MVVEWLSGLGVYAIVYIYEKTSARVFIGV